MITTFKLKFFNKIIGERFVHKVEKNAYLKRVEKYFSS